MMSKYVFVAVVALSCGLAMSQSADEAELGRAADPNSAVDSFCLVARDYMADQVRAKNRVPNFMAEIMGRARSSSEHALDEIKKIASNPEASLNALDEKAAKTGSSMADLVDKAQITPGHLLSMAQGAASRFTQLAWETVNKRKEYLEAADQAVIKGQNSLANKLRSNPVAPGTMLKNAFVGATQTLSAVKEALAKVPQKVEKALASGCVEIMNHEEELRRQLAEVGIDANLEDLDCATPKAVVNAAQACRALAEQEAQLKQLNN